MTTPLRNRVDLHCHTSRSDGVHEPAVLYEETRRYGMRLVAISDHDTLEGYRELRDAGLGGEPSPDGPQLIPAVEINSVGDDPLAGGGLGRAEGELHILGFGVDADDAEFEDALDRQRTLRFERVLESIDRLRAAGLPVEGVVEELPTGVGRSVGRPHLARALVARGAADSVEDAFARILSRGGPGYVPRQGMAVSDAIRTIRRAGGIAVLAHAPSAPDEPDDIDRLMEMGLGGLEVHYRTFERDTVVRMARFTEERGLLATGGSDYHGDTMSYAEAQATTHVPEDVADQLLGLLAGPRVPRGRPAR